MSDFGRPRGEWIEAFYTTGCSICKEQFRMSKNWANAHFNFCPNCGTPMTDKAMEIIRKREHIEMYKSSKKEWGNIDDRPIGGFHDY